MTRTHPFRAPEQQVSTPVIEGHSPGMMDIGAGGPKPLVWAWKMQPTEYTGTRGLHSGWASG